MKKKLIIGGIVVVAIIAIAGASSGNKATVTTGGAGNPAPVTATSAPAKVGDKVTSGNWSYMVTKVEKVKTLTWSDFGNKADALGTWVVVSMTLQNVGKQNHPINTFDFQLVDSAGTKYDTSSKIEVFSFVRYVKLTALGEQFPPGIDVKTALVFDVNPNATGLKVVLKQANDMAIALE